MPETIQGPEEILARILSLAQMKKDGGTGTCGVPPDMCFEVFQNGVGINQTGNATVDAALQTMRDQLVSTWNQQAGLVQAAAHTAFGEDYTVEFTTDGTVPELIIVKPST